MLTYSITVGDSKETFKLVNRLIGETKHEHQNFKLKTEETEVSESKETSEVSNKHFDSVSKSIHLKIPNTQNPKSGQTVDRPIFLTEVDSTEVSGEIKRLELSASDGVDLISNKFRDSSF